MVTLGLSSSKKTEKVKNEAIFLAPKIADFYAYSAERNNFFVFIVRYR
jgi:hypothetical protein